MGDFVSLLSIKEVTNFEYLGHMIIRANLTSFIMLFFLCRAFGSVWRTLVDCQTTGMLIAVLCVSCPTEWKEPSMAQTASWCRCVCVGESGWNLIQG